MTTITVYGDMQAQGTLEDRAKGQTLIGMNDAINYLYGDAYKITGIRGGNDVLIGGGGKGYFDFLYGDAYTMNDSQGGNDVLTAGPDSIYNYLYGDASEMFDNSLGGNDVLTVLSGDVMNSSNFLYGDAISIGAGGAVYGGAGGNDVLTVLTGNAGSLNYLYGDAANIFQGGIGGNDVLTVQSRGQGSSNNYLYGDASSLVGRGGNDVLTAAVGSNTNFLFGDADFLNGNSGLGISVGGNDLLIAGDRSVGRATTNKLYGDARYSNYGDVICGNDRLISGTGDDEMWGDIAVFDPSRITTGRDVFVFSNNNGTDIIHDFRHGEDKIELHGMADVTSFNEITSLEVSGEDAVITFGTNTITVIGVTDLTAADFLFS